MFTPFGNKTGNVTASWRPEPKYRGTYSILSSCLVTMALCIWSAVYLNHPGASERSAPFWRSKQLWRKIGCVFLGLFAPEFVAWTAFVQHRLVITSTCNVKIWLGQLQSESFLRRLRRKIRGFPRSNQPNHSIRTDVELPPGETELLPGRSDNPQRRYRHPWTMVHSYYSIMGGFAIDTSVLPPEIKGPFSSKKRITLTWSGVRLLMKREPHLLPQLSLEQIEDKAKANGLAKTIVCAQAIWFCLQCVTRIIQGLSISILELNVFCHALCTLLICILWWHKPLDIGEPTLIQGENIEEIFALMCIISGIGPFFGIKHIKWTDTTGTVRSGVDVLQDRSTSSKQFPSVQAGVGQSNEEAEITDLTRRSHLAVHSVHSEPLPKDPSFYGFEFAWTVHGLLDNDDNDEMSLSYCKLASQALKRYDTGRLEIHRSSWLPMLTDHTSNVVSPGGDSGHWDIKQSFYIDWEKTLIVSIIISAFLYGGLHLLAWNAPFRSRTEEWLWRSSGISIMASGPYILPLLFLPPDDDSKLDDFGWNLFIILAFFLGLVYVVARVYLVVECFINLAYLHDSVYEMPSWSQYFPHIS